MGEHWIFFFKTSVGNCERHPLKWLKKDCGSRVANQVYHTKGRNPGSSCSLQQREMYGGICETWMNLVIFIAKPCILNSVQISFFNYVPDPRIRLCVGFLFWFAFFHLAANSKFGSSHGSIYARRYPCCQGQQSSSRVSSRNRKQVFAPKENGLKKENCFVSHETRVFVCHCFIVFPLVLPLFTPIFFVMPLQLHLIFGLSVPRWTQETGFCPKRKQLEKRKLFCFT